MKSKRKKKVKAVKYRPGKRWWQKKRFFVPIGSLFLLVLMLIPIYINHLYFIGANGEPNTVFSASDALLYYGSVLSFIGTVALGGLALYQNSIFRAEATKMNARLEKVTCFNGCCVFKLTGCLILPTESNSFRIKATLENVGKSVGLFVLPGDFQFSRYAYMIPGGGNNIEKQIFDEHQVVIAPGKKFDFTSEPVSYSSLNNGTTYYMELGISIVSENQVQYDQEIEAQFEFNNGELKYIRETSHMGLRLI